MRLTTIQLQEDTKEILERKKIHARESYNSVIKRILETENIPSMEEMFRQGDKIKQTKTYTTKQIIEMSRELRRKR